MGQTAALTGQKKIVHDFACLLEGHMQKIPEESWHSFQIECLQLVHNFKQPTRPTQPSSSNPRHGSQTSGQSIVIGPVSINGLQQVHTSTMLGCQPRLQLCLYRYQRLLSSPLLRPHPPDVVMRWFPRFWKSLEKKNNVFNSSR